MEPMAMIAGVAIAKIIRSFPSKARMPLTVKPAKNGIVIVMKISIIKQRALILFF
jgi:hypothetical protein